jgi:hypothetical protein
MGTSDSACRQPTPMCSGPAVYPAGAACWSAAETRWANRRPICEKGPVMLSSAALLFVLHADAAWAPGGRSRPEDLVISLVTFGPGDDIPEWWGHTALTVIDRRLELGRLYNYGVVDFSESFLVRFLAGRPEFQVDEAGILTTYDLYRETDRDIRVQELNLTPAQALETANALAINVRPENCRYLYHHYRDNCSTRPRDIIDRAFGGALSRATAGPARMSLREHTRRYAQVVPAVSLWLDYMQNDELDGPITMRDEAFVPDELERQLDALVVDGQPAVKEKTTIHRSKTRSPTPALAPRWTAWLALVSALAGAAVLALSRSTRRPARLALGALLALEGLVWGLSGVFLFVIGTFTNNAVTHRNENLFLINPATLALLPLGVMLMRGSPRALPALKWLTSGLLAGGVLGVALKALPAFDQQNWNVIALVLPLSLATAVAFHRRVDGPAT